MKILSGYLLGVLAAFLSLYYSGLINEKSKEIKPCNCVSAREYKIRFESYEAYVDSLVWSGLRKDKVRTKRLQDSVVSKLSKLNF